MKQLIKSLIIYSTITFVFSACTAYKKIPYLKSASNEVTTDSNKAEIKIFPNDLLTIVVNTNTPEAAVAFNMALAPSGIISNSSVNTSLGLQTYLVKTDGTIDFPILGQLDIAGKTKNEVEKLIKEKIYPKYITEEPIVNIRIVNFKISVLGEVAKPSNYSIPNERVSIFDAIAMAGDLTLYGKRDNVLLLRENSNGEKQTIRINLQDKNLLNSPYYYLQQNDVVYVEQNKHKANASAISSAETLSISVTSTLISLTSLIITIFK